MTPEEKARVKIDKMFEDAGWQVVSRNEYTPNLTAAAIKEGLLKHNLEADYFLFINGKAVGILEAKRAEVDVNCDKVKVQAEKYANNVPPIYAAYEKPLRIIYLSNGEKIFEELPLQILKDNVSYGLKDDKLPQIHTLAFFLKE